MSPVFSLYRSFLQNRLRRMKQFVLIAFGRCPVCRRRIRALKPTPFHTRKGCPLGHYARHRTRSTSGERDMRDDGRSEDS